MRPLREWWVVVLLLLAAAGLRLVDLQGVPPGLEHDEVANWLIDRNILAGEHALYFTQAYGHEAGYHYLQTAAVALFGDHALSLRLPSVFVGLIGLAVSYALARKLLGGRVALINTALLATLWWPLFFSRLGVRAMLLPAVSGMALFWFWTGWMEPKRQLADGDLGTGAENYQSVALAGVLAGASLYTYMAARAVPLIFAVFSVYLFLTRRPLVLRRWRGLLLFWILMVLVAAPLLMWLAIHPGAEFRIGEIDQPLNALRQGDWRPVLENGVKLLGFFGWRGDPLIRQNLPGRPVFDPLGALGFYGGLLLVLWRWRRPELGLVLIWLGVSLAPSLVTADAPSSIRCVNALPMVGVPVGVAVDAWYQRSSNRRWLNAVVALWLLGSAGWTLRDYFFQWPEDSEVQFVWQTALREAAAGLDAAPDLSSAVVGGWNPDSMDAPTMALYLRREDLSLRFVDPARAVLIPLDGGRMVWPAVLPLSPEFERHLSVQEADVYRQADLSLAQLDGFPGLDQVIDFEGEIELEGYDVRPYAGGVILLTRWKVAGPAEEPVSVFVHLTDLAGTMVGQDDGLGAPAQHWRPNDTLLLRHSIEAPAGEYVLRLGWYNPVTGVRRTYSPAGELADTLELGRISIP